MSDTRIITTYPATGKPLPFIVEAVNPRYTDDAACLMQLGQIFHTWFDINTWFNKFHSDSTFMQAGSFAELFSRGTSIFDNNVKMLAKTDQSLSIEKVLSNRNILFKLHPLAVDLTGPIYPSIVITEIVDPQSPGRYTNSPYRYWMSGEVAGAWPGIPQPKSVTDPTIYERITNLEASVTQLIKSVSELSTTSLTWGDVWITKRIINLNYTCRVSEYVNCATDGMKRKGLDMGAIAAAKFFVQMKLDKTDFVDNNLSDKDIFDVKVGDFLVAKMTPGGLRQMPGGIRDTVH